VAVAGGRPGAGHSILAANLAVYLAQLGRRVVLVDSDGTGATLHRMLSLELSEELGAAGPLAEEELTTLPSLVPGLALLPQRYAQGSTSPERPGRTPRWAKGLRHLDADYVIVDLGPGTSRAALDLFLGADLGIALTAPDPPAVEATYRFVRALFQRQVQRSLLKDRYKMRMVERAMAELPPLPSPLELLRGVARYDQASAEAAASHLAALRTYLVTNHARLRQDADQGQVMGDLSARYLGATLEPLGHVEHDDAIWLSVVRRRPLLLDNPTAKSARNLERIARRVVALATARESARAAPVDFSDSRERSLYEVLWTHRGATDEELRRAYKRQREIFQEGSLPLCSLLSEEQRVRERARVEEAQETLLDPLRRRSYDLSFFGKDGGPSEDDQPAPSAAILAEREMLRAELAHELHSETEFTGPLLQRVRESQGVELEEIARRTKISSTHLAAIEAEDFGALPAEVYTRGFVQQVAQILGLDATQATRTYLRRYKAFRKARQGVPSS
jgi:flagellar biosynthesis protein FlhG